MELHGEEPSLVPIFRRNRIRRLDWLWKLCNNGQRAERYHYRRQPFSSWIQATQHLRLRGLQYVRWVRSVEHRVWSGVKLAIATAVGVGVATLTGCSAGGAAAPVADPTATVGSYLELGSYDDQLKWSKIVHNLQQESIVTCMNGQGFDYLRTPFVPSIPWEPKTRQEMARFGFGITLETPQGFEDPNQPAVALLGAEEREAFIDALLGPDSNGDGCLQAARSQYLQKIDDANEQMADAMADLRARVSADERWVE